MKTADELCKRVEAFLPAARVTGMLSPADVAADVRDAIETLTRERDAARALVWTDLQPHAPPPRGRDETFRKLRVRLRRVVRRRRAIARLLPP